MSRQGICGRCHEKAWLDRCRRCASWFCNLCFAMAGAVDGSLKHEKLSPEDLDAIDKEWDLRVPDSAHFKVFE